MTWTDPGPWAGSPSETYFNTHIRDNLLFLYAARTSLTAGYLYGLVLSNDGADPTNDIDIATGKARDASDTVDMVLASALVKRLDTAWAVGTNQGGLDTGAVGNNTYHIWLIKRSDTSVVDALFSLSASAPTMPTNYDYKRRIGSIVRAGGAIKLFQQDGDTFIWKVPVSDVAATNPGTAAVTRTLTIPTGIRVEAIIGVLARGTTNTGNPVDVFVSDLSITDTAPTTSAFSIAGYNGSAVENYVGSTIRVFTNTSAQVRSRVEVSTANTVLYLNSLGWVDTRNRFAP